MKRIATIAAVATVLASATPAAAQTFGFGAHAGVSIPTGDYGDVASTGFSAGLDLTYPLLMVTPGLNWYTSADVVAHSVEDESPIVDDDEGFLYLPVMTGLQFELPVGGFRPFLNAQGGLVLSRPPGDAGDWGTDLGFVLGGGAYVGRNFYIGAKYYPLSIDFEVEGIGDTDTDTDVDFIDIYVGFGVH